MASRRARLRLDAMRRGNPQPMETTYRVKGMTCGHCTAAVEREVLGLDGVRGVEADLGSKLVRISGAELDDAAIRAAIAEAGYQAEPA